MESEIRQRILDLVHSRPRAVSEIAEEIKKNWRTADRYVEQLALEDLVKVHVFRKGGKGALKVVYWPTSINESPSSVKNFLLQKILMGSKKEDFSPLDIIQNIPEKNRSVYFVQPDSYHGDENVEDFFNSLKRAKSQLLFFSGNLTFANIGNKYDEFLNLVDKKVEEGINIFIISRVDISNKKIIEDLFEINKRGHKGKIEIRYAYQPLRCTVIDDREARFKEQFSGYVGERQSESKTGTHIYITNNGEWVGWIIDVFWHFWRGSMDASKRLQVLEQTLKI